MKVYLVGGAVRDALLHRPVTERDWVVVGTTPEAMREKGYTQVGKDFPVFLHPKTKEEYALARTERKAGQGYTGFECYAAPDVSLEDDLIRRDLTINAIAQAKDGSLTDPFNGLQDLKARTLRHISPAFSEDPLRVFRVARFAARYADLGFTIAPETLSLMRAMADSGELRCLSAERVWKETEKCLSEGRPGVFFRTLAETNALGDWFSEWLPHTDALIALMEQGTSAQAAPEEIWALLGIVLTDVNIIDLCTRLKCANKYSDLAVLCARYHGALRYTAAPTSLLPVLKRCDAWRKPERFEQLLTVVGIAADTQEQQQFNQVVLRAVDDARKVNAQAFVERGLRGPEVGKAVDAARDSIIRQQISY
ncbi:CCA tRNA nucleotidyltransferase [Aestuariibacter sp. A3R04]|uniref:CCA tRNA nucleotidyltransferase n=1 Tax=Aestuariibacter sp. A3R04 TaxID=2841571 RepID=UPI001C08D14C|nr:CCA tRNA nucleotidyltransferase [Aestuariibacter sp. A3R04]MBU3022064.1 CCA tRNA nucleotidyltransferase [Aestuariibacter sp. A3R04]